MTQVWVDETWAGSQWFFIEPESGRKEYEKIRVVAQTTTHAAASAAFRLLSGKI